MKSTKQAYGLERYEGIMADWAQSIIEPFIDKNKIPQPITMDEKERKYFEKIFNGFSEISDAMEYIRLCRKLMETAAPRSRRIDNDKYTKFIIASYFNEIYILQERLFSYVRNIRKTYKKHHNSKKITIALDGIEKSIHESLSGISSTRGAHVHEKRYSDKNLEWFSMVHLVSKHSKNEDFLELKEIEYRKTKITWTNTMKKNEDSLEQFLDAIFNILHDTIIVDGRPLKPDPSYKI